MTTRQRIAAYNALQQAVHYHNVKHSTATHTDHTAATAATAATAECSICLAQIVPPDEITTLCNHTFHISCYLSSLKYST